MDHKQVGPVSGACIASTNPYDLFPLRNHFR